MWIPPGPLFRFRPHKGKLLLAVNSKCNYSNCEKMNENLYEAIFKRKSIRNYDSAPIDQNRLEEISENLHALKPMSPGITT
jgi:hypothetical protein